MRGNVLQHDLIILVGSMILQRKYNRIMIFILENTFLRIGFNNFDNFLKVNRFAQPEALYRMVDNGFAIGIIMDVDFNTLDPIFEVFSVSFYL